jgi:hypothetical protein
MVPVAALLGTGACSAVVGADFDNAHLRTSQGNDSLPLLAEVRAPGRTQTPAQFDTQFGSTLAVYSTALALTAPYQDVETVAGPVAQGGASYLLDLKNVSATPFALVALNVDADDGVAPASLLPSGFPKPGDFGSMHVALSDQLVVVGVGGEGSATTHPDDNSAPKAGAVYVYSRTSSGVSPQYIKAPRPEAGALFGQSVSLSGSHLAVGAPFEDTDGTDSGAVYVFEWSKGRFDDSKPVRVPRNVAHAGDSFGLAVALDGDLLVVGAPGESSGGTQLDADPTDTSVPLDGAAYVYRLVDGEWSLEHYVKPGYARTESGFGLSVALSNGRFAVGAPWASNCPGDDTFSREGVVYVYSDPSAGSPRAAGAGAAPTDAAAQAEGTWSLETCLSEPGAHNAFGWSVALLGGQLVVGAPWSYSGRTDDLGDASSSYAGAAFLYERDPAGEWTRRAFLKAPDLQANDVFGLSVGLASGLVAVGAPYAAGRPHALGDASQYSGAAYLFSTAPSVDAGRP